MSDFFQRAQHHAAIFSSYESQITEHRTQIAFGVVLVACWKTVTAYFAFRNVLEANFFLPVMCKTNRLVMTEVGRKSICAEKVRGLMNCETCFCPRCLESIIGLASNQTEISIPKDLQ